MIIQSCFSLAKPYSVPSRVADFIASLKGMSNTVRSIAVFCSICRNLPKKPRLSSCNHMYCETCWKNLLKVANTKKPTEVRCRRAGCLDHLGKATIVPRDLDITNIRNSIWTGGKNATGTNGAADLGGGRRGDTMKVDRSEDSIAAE